MGTYGVKTGGRDFKPGESGNPDGRPKLPEDIKEARKLNKIELERILNEYMHMPLKDIQARANLPDTPAFEVLLAKIIAEGIKKGDEKRLGFLLDRVVGPVKAKLSLDGGEDEKGDAKPLRVELAERIKQATEKKE